MDEEIFGWEMEEEILEEKFLSLFLSGEELEEGTTLSQEIRRIQDKLGGNRRLTDRTPISLHEPPLNRQLDVNLWDAGHSPVLNQKTCTSNAHRRLHRLLTGFHRRSLISSI
ncbi:hypothetical protein HAX54_021238 [Datura stramonium]|uniref:Uncharacterized protein n=1 Tax=Datura stramonium TaxID=4076 RepID=A0ABS8UT48_DATST|nr:hypothetical protein [Datura stramonium]